MKPRIFESTTCIIFYDFDFREVDLKQWMEKAIALFERFQIPLIYFSATAEDIKSKKVTSFKYGYRFIHKRGFKDLESLSIQSDSPQEDPNSIERDASAYIGDDGYSRSYMIFHVNEKMLSIDSEQVESIIIELADIVKPYYGLAHKREYEKGPVFYMCGIIMGLDDRFPDQEAEKKRIGKWAKQYQYPDGTYRTGLLREIYPLNLLSKAHLEEPVDDATLEQWILSSPDHGTLKPLHQDLWCWRVPEDNIAAVTNGLKESQIILCI